MKRGTPECGKMHELAERLHVHRLLAVGIMESLWHTAAKYTPQGNIGRFSDAWICERIGWNKKPESLIAALVESHWLDRDEQHRLLIHDWSEHCEASVHQLLKKRHELFADGERPFNKSSQTIHEPFVNHSRLPSDGMAMAGQGIGNSSEKGSGEKPQNETERWANRRDPAAPLGWPQAIEAASRACMSIDPSPDSPVALEWQNAQFCDKRDCIGGIYQRIDCGQFGAKVDPQYIPSFENFFKRRRWGESLRPRGHVTRLDRKEAAREEFDKRMRRELEEAGHA